MVTKVKQVKRVLVVALAIAILSVSQSRAADEKAVEKGDAPKIQMAILLDTSGSMRGLLDQARTQLWTIVNEFTSAKRNGQRPLLEVGLYEYGHDSLGEKNGYMRQIVPLTDNLDKISEELFKLATGGSKEYCGMVIDKAAAELKWSESSKDLKCIFIAGNEAFTQGTVDYREACHKAANKGITVSTIFCGPHDEGVKTMWQEASKLADGSYMNIDQNQQVAAIAAPQDKDLAALNTKLNSTYIAYGSEKERMESVERQTAQDTNASSANPVASNARIQFKASHLYNNAKWDLCDALSCKQVKLEDLKDDQLPEFLRKMSVEDRKKFIEAKIAERTKIQDEIKTLSEARGKYVAEELKKQAAETGNTLDVAIVNAARKQAEVKQFKFEK